jgi:ADP-heptose:LPS heptosyltransferase
MKKIMLVLVKDMGDVILNNPLARNIKEHHGEDTEITLFTNTCYLELVGYNPDFHKIEVCENWLTQWDLILQHAIKGGYDKVMIPQQIKWEDGIWHQLDYLRHNHLLNYYQLRCGLPVKKTPLVFYPNPKIGPEIINFKYAVIHCQTRNPDKDFKDWYTLNQLLTDAGYTIYQVGGDKDLQMVDDDHIFKGSFTEIWHLMNNADMFIGLDSGLTSLAATTGSQVFQLCGCTIPKTSGGYGDNVYHIVSESCPTCRPIRCHAHCKSKPTCIERLDVDRVWRLIKRKMKITEDQGDTSHNVEIELQTASDLE